MHHQSSLVIQTSFEGIRGGSIAHLLVVPIQQHYSNTTLDFMRYNASKEQLMVRWCWLFRSENTPDSNCLFGSVAV